MDLHLQIAEIVQRATQPSREEIVNLLSSISRSDRIAAALQIVRDVEFEGRTVGDLSNDELVSYWRFARAAVFLESHEQSNIIPLEFNR